MYVYIYIYRERERYMYNNIYVQLSCAWPWWSMGSSEAAQLCRSRQASCRQASWNRYN